jgi:hypothetical protein
VVDNSRTFSFVGGLILSIDAMQGNVAFRSNSQDNLVTPDLDDGNVNVPSDDDSLSDFA